VKDKGQTTEKRARLCGTGDVRTSIGEDRRGRLNGQAGHGIDKQDWAPKLAAVRECPAVAIACLLVLVGCSKNHPPLGPSLLIPTPVQRGDSVRASLFSYDREGDSLEFFVQWGDGTESGWIGPVTSATEYGIMHAYEETGTFYARAKVKDATHESGWSDSSFIRVGEYGPYSPRRPSGPDSVSVGDTVTYATAAGHPLQRRVAIQFDWGDTLGDWSGFVGAGESLTARHAFTRGGMMLVRARARDSLDHVSDWSKPESVQVVEVNTEARSSNPD
jgi:hypothetical protein